MTPEQRIAAAPRAWAVKKDRALMPGDLFTRKEEAALYANALNGSVVPVAIVELPEET